MKKTRKKNDLFYVLTLVLVLTGLIVSILTSSIIFILEMLIFSVYFVVRSRDKKISGVKFFIITVVTFSIFFLFLWTFDIKLILKPENKILNIILIIMYF